ncbi:hypothetical protein GUITHDRAFT_109847 [Guillardia theta CCMP2712]|uniref:Uncharacterized protein n=1 Tax=Guillardia theta (strain CCMP2712) TaxID=905079 RepID=L1J691_GUITC|nr:hypothetical protein GUITHDRAFT_109847 [Guillardia theta CCMP2712]EKX44058.1 hypothetical protein GUITHDRAFT_109847 [Guillardia theta CCMP2712]|eukprot:XP_005831038.1 hypothetical protein GUITHDRAFT_109847 [Guillardia theta CCMP2712]
MSSKLLALVMQPSRLTFLQRKSKLCLESSDDKVHFFVFRWHQVKHTDGLRQIDEVEDRELRAFDEQVFADELHKELHARMKPELSWLFKIYAHKIYLDVNCISYLSVNHQAFSKERYLGYCTMFVPVITWGKVTSVLGILEGVQEGSDRECEFLQLVLAMIYLLEKNAGRLRLVMPILRDEGGGFVPLEEAVGRLSSAGSSLNSQKACLLLLGAGVQEDKDKMLAYLSGVSVRDAVMKLLSNSSRRILGLGSEPAAVRGACGVYLVAKGLDERRSAEGAGAVITEHLVDELREQVAERLLHYEKHNPRGSEMTQVLKQTGTFELLHEFFALRGIDSLDRLTAVNTMKSMRGARTLDDSEELCEEINRAKETFYDQAVEAIGSMVNKCSKDQRFLPLDTRLDVYRDNEVDGILALRSSNALETALLKTPAQCCVAFLGCLQYAFQGVMIRRMIERNSIWLLDPHAQLPVEPRTVQVSRLVDACLGFVWGSMYMAGLLMCKYNTPLNAKRVFIGAAHLMLWLKIISSISDFIQCGPREYESTSCSGFSSFVIIASIVFVLYFVHFKQHYIWIVAFLFQGAYCIRDGFITPEESKIMFVVLGIICLLIDVMIVVKYRICYYQTFKDLSVAMEGFEKTWSRIVATCTDKIDDISNNVQTISQELKIWTRRQGCLLAMMKGRTSRYSSSCGKIRQQNKSIETLFEHAQEVSAAFQMWVGQWNPVGEVVHGKVKSCERAIQKTVRSYHRDASCLTDLVRCTVVVKTVEEVLVWVKGLRSMSVVAKGLSGSINEEIKMLSIGEETYLNITSIKNRYDWRCNLKACGGYRDLCVCVEVRPRKRRVGWTVNATNKECTFVPLKQWDTTPNLRRHICEIQVLLEDLHKVKKHLHKEYVNFRNVLCQ